MKSQSFHDAIHASITNPILQIALEANTVRRTSGRLAAFASVPDHQERRARAHAVRAEVVTHLEEYLEKFTERAQANGMIVHRAADTAEAIGTVLSIAQEHNAHLVAKSKSMISEEIELNHALEKHGIRAVETDLGEYIVQLRGERPSHIITPAVHLRRQDVGQLFHDKLGIPYTEDVAAMTATARQVLRQVFLTAEVGISGVNFGVAETGTLCIVTNEGNGRMCTTLPPVHIALMGIERLLPTLDDLALFLSLLPRSATGQKLSAYTSLIHSPRRAEDRDGPWERHLILVDNGRSKMRSSPLAEALYCIRCGACLNACPVFREIGGHAYRGTDGSVAPYPGPIGSVVSPGLFGLEQFGQLAQASTLCGACKEACPVDIDLPALLLRVRAGRGAERRAAQEGTAVPAAVKMGLVGFRLAAGHARLFAAAQTIGGLFSRIFSPRSGYMRLPALTGWGYSKDLPRLETRPFRSRWNEIQQEITSRPIEAEAVGVQQSPTVKQAPSLTAQFSDELSALGGKVIRVLQKELAERLVDFLHERGIGSVVMDESAIEFALPLQKAGIAVKHEADPDLRCGVTGALAGLADTGSLIIVGGRSLSLSASLLPEIHMVLLRASDLLPTLAEALRRPEIRRAPAAVVVTGPSRTSDIEMTLTIGVHGPGELRVYLIDDSSGG
jgi:L-lactate dehydrogenase complex protein LldF